MYGESGSRLPGRRSGAASIDAFADTAFTGSDEAAFATSARTPSRIVIAPVRMAILVGKRMSCGYPSSPQGMSEPLNQLSISIVKGLGGRTDAR